MCVGFLNLLVFSPIVGTKDRFWAMSKCHIWSCSLAITDGKLNSNVSYQLSWRLVAVFHMQRAHVAHLLTQQPGSCLSGLRPRECRKYSYVLLFLPYSWTSRKTFSGHSWVGINRGEQQFTKCVCMCTCLCVLKSLVMTWFTAAVHLLLKTFFYVVPNKARLPSLIGGHQGRGWFQQCYWICSVCLANAYVSKLNNNLHEYQESITLFYCHTFKF